jgi:hypothetical protein
MSEYERSLLRPSLASLMPDRSDAEREGFLQALDAVIDEYATGRWKQGYDEGLRDGIRARVVGAFEPVAVRTTVH